MKDGIETWQRFIAAALPVVFYFSPRFLVGPAYLRHHEALYLEIKDENELTALELIELKNGIRRLVDYIGFLNIIAVTLIGLLYNGEHRQFFFESPSVWLYITPFFLACGLNIYINNRSNLMVNTFGKVLEIAILVYTVVLFFIYPA
jgi:hypothetical protein